MKTYLQKNFSHFGWAFVVFIFLFNFTYAGEVKCWREELQLPTYIMGPDEKNPILKDFQLPEFFRFRSSRSVYPYTFQDRFTREKKMVSYDAIYLENDYIKVIILPELRGRVQAAIDKRNDWDFLYYNHVIKPADIAIRAAWIAGGLEWNHPGGHGYTQFNRISYKILDEPDGGKTVLVGEIEPNRIMKWETAITLRPNRLYLETKSKFFSTQPYPVQFASSTNPAMHATEEMEMIYPRGTYVTGHGKKKLQSWPVFEDGVDYSWVKNTKRKGNGTLSIFSEGCTEDFFGCYSHDKQAGTLIVTDHRTAPGQKYFSWGYCEQGRRWDTLLSDEDGPYVELQVGAFWDNLGYGHAWLNPLEVKEFTIYWIPVKETDGFVTANRDICLNVKGDDDKIKIAVQATREIPAVVLTLNKAEEVFYKYKYDLQLDKALKLEIDLPDNIKYEDISVTLSGSDNRELMSYKTAFTRPDPPILPPKEKPLEQMTIDELYIKGQSYYLDPFCTQARDCFLEILKRSQKHIRANNALGIYYYHHGEFEKSRKYFKSALLNFPLNEEGYRANFFLGLLALEDENITEALEHFMISSRYKTFTTISLYHLAKCSFLKGDYHKTIDYLNESKSENIEHPALELLRAITYRKLNDPEAAQKAIDNVLSKDPLSFGGYIEKWFWLDKSKESEKRIHQLFDREDETFVGSQLYLETAVLYMELNLWTDATSILETAHRYFSEKKQIYPMIEYYLGYCCQQSGDSDKAATYYKNASKQKDDYVFPYRVLSEKVLKAALDKHPDNSNAWLYLGNLLYHHRRHSEAVRAWEKSANMNTANSVTHRNLANAYWFIDKDLEKSAEAFEKAIRCNPNDSLLYMELDHVYEAMGLTEKRLSLLENNSKVTSSRDDLVLRWADLYLRLKQYDKALSLMENTYFYPREANSNVQNRFAIAHWGLAQNLLNDNKPQKAIEHLSKAMTYPPHLSEGKPYYRIWTRFYYLLGLAYEATNENDKAVTYFNKAAEESVRDISESVYFQALAYRKLNNEDKAVQILIDLANDCNETLKKEPDSPAVMYYLLSKACNGVKKEKQANQYLNKALELDPDVELKAAIEASNLPQDDI